MWSVKFIREVVQDSYDVYYGRPANDPEVLFRLLFLQTLHQLSLAQKGVRSAIDLDASFGKKSKTRSFFSYKSHLIMTEEEIITGVLVTTGATDDGQFCIPLVEQSLKRGVSCTEVLADTVYSSRKNLSWLQAKKIVISPFIY